MLRLHFAGLRRRRACGLFSDPSYPPRRGAAQPGDSSAPRLGYRPSWGNTSSAIRTEVAARSISPRVRCRQIYAVLESHRHVSLAKAIARHTDVKATTHGFRSTFRDWAGDMTSFPREVCEQALAHVIEDETEAAYRRSDALAKRRLLLDEWAAYCLSELR
jgi:integrase